MLPNRALRALGSASINRQCTRCIQSSSRHLAEDTPPRRNRRARSEAISAEVELLQRGPPPAQPHPQLQEPTTTAQPPSQSPIAFTGSLSTPPTTAPGRMGENDSPARENITNQGVVFRPTTVTEPSEEHVASRPDTVTARREGWVDVLTPTTPGDAKFMRRNACRVCGQNGHWKDTCPQRKACWVCGQDGHWKSTCPNQAVVSQREGFLRSGEGTATLAAGNFAGLVEDRLRVAMEPGLRAGTRITREQIAQKLFQRQQVRLPGDWFGKNTPKPLRMRDEIKKTIVERVVKGEFDKGGVLRHEKEFSVVDGVKKDFRRHPVNEVRRKLMLNGTYLGADQKKLVAKVEGFMTAEQWKQVRYAGW